MISFIKHTEPLNDSKYGERKMKYQFALDITKKSNESSGRSKRGQGEQCRLIGYTSVIDFPNPIFKGDIVLAPFHGFEDGYCGLKLKAEDLEHVIGYFSSPFQDNTSTVKLTSTISGLPFYRLAMLIVKANSLDHKEFRNVGRPWTALESATLERGSPENIDYLELFPQPLWGRGDKLTQEELVYFKEHNFEVRDMEFHRIEGVTQRNILDFIGVEEALTGSY